MTTLTRDYLGVETDAEALALLGVPAGGRKDVGFEAQHPRYPKGHPRAGEFMDKPDAVAYRRWLRETPKRLDAEFSEWDDSLPEAARELLTSYSTGRSRRVNDALRGKSDAADIAETRDFVAELDVVLARHRLHERVEVYRGVDDFESVFGVPIERAGEIEGITFADPAFVSTSTRRKVVEGNFGAQDETGTPAIMHLSVPEGIEAAWVPLGLLKRQRPGLGGNLPKLRREGELLLARNRRIRVTRVEVETVPEETVGQEGYAQRTYAAYDRVIVHAEMT